jgi:uncharacterized protein YecT (DUF1311 family)
MKAQSTWVKLVATVACCLAFAGCNQNDHTAANGSLLGALPSANTKPADEWSLETKNSAMDGQVVVATKKFKRLSHDKETKSIIKVDLTCVVPKKELTLSMRAGDVDSNVGEMPTQFDSELSEQGNIPIGRMKSKASEPLPIGNLVTLQQDNLLVWPISYLTTGNRSQMTQGLLAKAFLPSGAVRESMLLNAAEGIAGIPNATKYRDMNSMFSGERPWIFEVSSGKDPFEISVPEQSQSASVDQVLKFCDADPNAKPIALDANNQQAQPPTPEPAAAPAPTPTTQVPAPAAPPASPALAAVALTPVPVPAPVTTPAITATPTPSFDCAKASSNIEKMICGSATLAKADADLATVYHSALQQAAGDQLSSIKSAERDFIKQRNQCQTADCVNGVYLTRLAQLQQPAAIH